MYTFYVNNLIVQLNIFYFIYLRLKKTILQSPASLQPVFTISYNFMLEQLLFVSRDSALGIAAHYGLDGLGIESRWGARLSASAQTGRGAHPASHTMDNGSF